jgi:hypothetical protein
MIGEKRLSVSLLTTPAGNSPANVLICVPRVTAPVIQVGGIKGLRRFEVACETLWLVIG